MEGRRKKKAQVILALGLFFMALVFGLYLRKQNDFESPEYVFSYADNQTEDYPTTQGGYYFAKLVEERTKGRIKILVQADAVLGSENDVVAQMQFGGIDFTRASLGTFAEVAPELNVLNLPFLYQDSAHMWRVLDGDVGDYFMNRIDDYEVVGLSWYDAGARSFYTSKQPINKLDDLSDMVIRVQDSQIMRETVEALGAKAKIVNYAEVYSSLQTGEVDGAENNWASYETMRHYSVAKHMTIDEHTRLPEIQLCSAVTWSKLSESDRQIIRECAKESALYERKLWKEREEQAKNRALNAGVTVHELSDDEKLRFREAVQPVYDKYGAQHTDIIEKINELK